MVKACSMWWLKYVFRKQCCGQGPGVGDIWLVSYRGWVLSATLLYWLCSLKLYAEVRHSETCFSSKPSSCLETRLNNSFMDEANAITQLITNYTLENFQGAGPFWADMYQVDQNDQERGGMNYYRVCECFLFFFCFFCIRRRLNVQLLDRSHHRQKIGRLNFW